MKKTLFLFFILFTNLFSFSQTIYGLKKTINGSLSIPFDVVSIDPNIANSNIEISTNSLVAVAAGASAYDQQNNRFICWGYDFANVKKLYVMDIDDSISANYPFTAIQPIEMEYDLQSQKLYGLWWDGFVEHFGEIDLQTGLASTISTLPSVNAVAIGNSTFDSNTGTYIFIGISGNDTKLYRVSAIDGSVLSSPTIFDDDYPRYSALEFNVNNNTLYGLVQDIDSSDYSQNFFSYFTNLRLAEIDMLSGFPSIVDSQLNVINGYLPGYSIGGLCFDQQSQTYIINVQNENNSYLKLIDVTSGNIIGSTVLNSTDYFYELQVNNYIFAQNFYSSTDFNEANSFADDLIQRKEINKINLLGRSSKVIKNQPLFYIYDDGTVEKKLIIE
jgi:hypothetical protein